MTELKVIADILEMLTARFNLIDRQIADIYERVADLEFEERAKKLEAEQALERR